MRTAVQNERCTAGFAFLQGLEARKAERYNGGSIMEKIGAVLRYFSQERKFSPKRKFLAGYPCGHPAKNFGQGLQILENKHFGTDIPHGRP